jgi:hypothetical protein
LLGHWKNFDELEESLSINELDAILNSMREKEHREMKFMASLQGVDLDEAAKEPEDVTALKNARIASDEGFGVGEGLGFMSQE